MRFHSGRPRYPKRRNVPRIVLLAALPVLLLSVLMGVSALFSSDDEPEGRDQGATTLAAYGIAELSDAEAYPLGPLTASTRFDHLRLEKGKRRLTAFSGDAAVRVYLVALGKNPMGHKEVEGDMRTPEGLYVIDGKNPRSAYHLNLGISYPNEADRAHATSLGKSPGGDIKIHGLAPEVADIGQAHRLTDWTYGCIAVTNEEIEELFARTPVGTPIEIVP